MNNRYLKEKLIVYLFKCLMIAFIALSVYFVWVTYYNPELPLSFFKYGNYLLAVSFTVLYVIFVKVYGGFMVGTASVLDLIFSQVISLGFVEAAKYVIFSLLSYDLLSPLPFIVNFGATSVVAALWCFVADYVYFRLHRPKTTIVIYGNIGSYESMKGIRGMTKRFNVTKTYYYGDISFEKVCKKIDEVDAVFTCGVPSDYRNEVLKYCIANNKACYVKPKISDTILRGGKTIQMMNVPVYRCKRSDTRIIYLFVKRSFDIVLSLIAIVISSPFMLGTAAAIKAYDKGKVFYKQTRLTKDGRTFEIIKFRSMVENAEKDGVARLAKESDDRITPVGRIIRKLRLDELPQLFNILKGDMSFVGPRPERPEIAKQYEKEMPEFALRLQAKAGLTGYAQVYGKYNTPPYDKVQMDLMYIANQSLVEDLKLMLMTFKILFIPSSTEGVGDDQTTANK